MDATTKKLEQTNFFGEGFLSVCLPPLVEANNAAATAGRNG